MKKILENKPVIMSAPCRLDFGGTLDISTFYFPLKRYSPSTFNMAINMRTRVALFPYISGRVKISSRGFETAEFDAESLPLVHPMGLMFAIAAYFGASGVHIDIESSSPPRSALGGSSVAAVALISAFMRLRGRFSMDPPLDEIVLLAHHIESSVARVPCGIQDQLAAAFGGVNQWHWTADVAGLPYERNILKEQDEYNEINTHFVAAYCGNPHESKDINGKWVEHFLNGTNIEVWKNIIDCCNQFSEAIGMDDYILAAELMRRETDYRLGMTPDVLDDVGIKLNELALENDCGARFTGAGGGGCIWALGEKDKITALKSKWSEELVSHENTTLLNVSIDGDGVRLEN